MTKVAVLKSFFGLLPGQNSVAFLKEIKALGEDEATDLAKEAATALGVSLKD
jgi:hypothetical protein